MEVHYKGFSARLYYAGEAGVFYGEIRETTTLITFQGVTVKECERAMHEAVDTYLIPCPEVS